MSTCISCTASTLAPAMISPSSRVRTAGAPSIVYNVSCVRAPLIWKVSAAAEREVEVAQGSRAASPGKKLRHVDRIAAVQLLVLNLLAGDLALYRCGLGLQDRSGGRHFDGLGSRSERKHGVDRDRAVGRQHIVCALKSLKARGLGRHGVQRRGQVGTA